MKRRSRIGVVVPSSNVVIERELAHAVPDSTTVHFTRAWYRFDNLEDPRPLDPLPDMADDTVRAVAVLADARVDAISSGSTAGSFFGGVGYERTFIERMESQSGGIPAITPATAVAEAMHALGARTVSILTPYLPPLYEAERAYFSERGYDVVNATGIGVVHGRDMADIDPRQVDDFVRASFEPAADVCFVSCTNLNTFDWIDGWERALGRPVVTSNQAMLWMLLGLAGVPESVTGLGQLLADVPRPRGVAQAADAHRV